MRQMTGRKESKQKNRERKGRKEGWEKRQIGMERMEKETEGKR